MKKSGVSRLVVFLFILFTVSTSGFAVGRTVTDMAGRTVTVPDTVSRVVTIGSVPCINTFIMALGQGDKIVNGLPAEFTRTQRWRYQTVFAPGMAKRPRMQGANREPNIEELLKADPDVVFTMDKTSVDIMEKNRLPLVVLSWKEPEDVKTAMKLLGQILNQQQKAEEYTKYFDDTLRRVDTLAARVPADQKPKVLYCSIKTLTQPHLIAEWWISKAGGISVTGGSRKVESVSFTIEQLLEWDPDILIVSDLKEVDAVYKDKRFGNIKAVINRKVYPTPVGAHVWGNRTTENPLTVLWAAATFYPKQLGKTGLEKEVSGFYKRFFNYQLSGEQVTGILNGK